MPHLAVVFNFAASSAVTSVQLIAERPDVTIAPFIKTLNEQGECFALVKGQRGVEGVVGTGTRGGKGASSRVERRQ